MKPILFSESRTRAQGFNSFGEAVLSDAISCVVTEELNGEFEMEMVYPISGFRFAKIQPRSIILVGTTPRDNSGYNVQPFRVYSIVKNSDGTATILARHLSYDLNGIPVTTLFGSNGVGITLSQLCTYLTTYAAFTNDFQYSTDYTGSSIFITEDIMSIRALIGMAIETFGVDVEFDGYDVNFLQTRGTNRGARILYGKNLISLSQEQNLEELYTGVYAYYKNKLGQVTRTAEADILTYQYKKLLAVDMSDEFEETPSAADLLTAAQNYITDNGVGIPKVEFTISLAQLRDALGGVVSADQVVKIGDEVLVMFEQLGVNTTARINRIVFDALANEIIEVGVGSRETNISNTVATTSEVTAKNAKKTKMVEDIVGKYCLQYREQLTSGSLDNIDRQGHYYVVTANVPSVSGKPSDVSSPYNVIHFNSAGSRAFQILFTNGTGATGFWWRNRTSGGSWSPWTKVINDEPVDVSSGFSVTKGTNMSAASIAGAYYSHGYCTLRINTTNSATLANGASMTGTVSFPAGYTPKMVVNSVSYYSGSPFVALMRVNGTFDLINCGNSISASHGVNVTFTYPCG